MLADLVGDSIGACATRGTDILESIAAEIFMQWYFEEQWHIAAKCRWVPPLSLI